MYWFNPDTQGSIIKLEFLDELYNDTYLQAVIPLTTTFTQLVGNIDIWIVVAKTENEVVFKTNTIKVPIYEHKDFTDIVIVTNPNVIESLQAQIGDLDAGLQSLYDTAVTLDEVNALFAGLK
jgi:hypothetical protein